MEYLNYCFFLFIDRIHDYARKKGGRYIYYIVPVTQILSIYIQQKLGLEVSINTDFDLADLPAYTKYYSDLLDFKCHLKKARRMLTRMILRYQELREKPPSVNGQFDIQTSMKWKMVMAFDGSQLAT